MPVILVLGKLKQKIVTKENEDCKFQASSLALKKKKSHADDSTQL